MRLLVRVYSLNTCYLLPLKFFVFSTDIMVRFERSKVVCSFRIFPVNVSLLGSLAHSIWIFKVFCAQYNF